jgi:hypothetical protein
MTGASEYGLTLAYNPTVPAEVRAPVEARLP